MLSNDVQFKIYLKLLFILLIPLLAFIGAYVLINFHPETICVWKNLLHIDCWGCGITRAFYSLCQLDFAAAWNYNPRIYVVVPLLIYIWLREVIKTLKQLKR